MHNCQLSKCSLDNILICLVLRELGVFFVWSGKKSNNKLKTVCVPKNVFFAFHTWGGLTFCYLWRGRVPVTQTLAFVPVCDNISKKTTFCLLIDRSRSPMIWECG
jgi:hypothetical protein